MSSRLRTAAILATGMALTASAAPAVALPSPTQAEARDRVITRRADVDGDRRSDRITMRYRDGRSGITLSVRTATGRTSTMRLPGADAPQSGIDPWTGTAAIDGVNGADILFVENFGDLPHFAVATWRRGRLVKLGPPDGGTTWTINHNYEGAPGYWGYSFGTEGRTRTVTTWNLQRTRSGRFYGPGATYRWTSRGWRHLRTNKVSMKSGQAAKVTYFGGLRITR